jgi:uncharacterized protein YndB with AHSA1/START domain
MAFAFRISIDAPPEKVFDYVADVTRHPEWANRKAGLRMSEVSGGPPAVGAKYRSESTFFGKPAVGDITVTAYEPPRRFAFMVNHQQEGKKDVHIEHTFTVTPQGGGALVERKMDGDGNPIAGLVFYPAIRADFMAALRNLKARLERSSA